MSKTYQFKLGGIANDFRFLFTHRLSEKALQNSWKSSISLQTNGKQNAVYFEQSIGLDTARTVEAVYGDIQDVLKSIRDEEWEFDAICLKKAYSYVFKNIRRSSDFEILVRQLTVSQKDELATSIKSSHANCEHEIYGDCGIYEAIHRGASDEEVILATKDVDDELIDDFMSKNHLSIAAIINKS